MIQGALILHGWVSQYHLWKKFGQQTCRSECVSVGGLLESDDNQVITKFTTSKRNGKWPYKRLNHYCYSAHGYNAWLSLFIVRMYSRLYYYLSCNYIWVIIKACFFIMVNNKLWKEFLIIVIITFQYSKLLVVWFVNTVHVSICR